MKTLLCSSAAAGALLALAAAPTQAATPCSLTDLNPVALDCAGFYAGNLLNGSPADRLAQKAALADLGFSWDGDFSAVEKLDDLNGSHTVDFDTLLQGISYVGFHFGNGKGGPGNATAFYRIDAGAGLDSFLLNFNASSGAVLYDTTPAIPEPGSYALMLAGLGVVAWVSRRRQAG